MDIETYKDAWWWDLLRKNCKYRNGYGKCINRPNRTAGGYVRCESQGCPLLRKPNTKRGRG